MLSQSGLTLILIIEAIKYIAEFVLAFFKREATDAYCAQDVTVIFSCKNESEFITKTITSALLANRFCRHIIVVDDFSTDSTYECAMKAFTFRDNVKVIRRSSGTPGKFHAQQEGLKHVTTNYVMFVDGDCIIPADFFIPYSITNASAVSFRVKPVLTSPLNFVERYQVYEYEKAYIAKTAHSIKGVNCCISGAAGLFHTETLKTIMKEHNGIFHGDDLQTTLLFQKHGHRVDHCNVSISTDVPKTLWRFLRQRALSWNVGGHLNAKNWRKIVYSKNTSIWHRLVFAWEYLALATDFAKLAFIGYCLIFEPWLLFMLYIWYVCLELTLYLIQFKRLNQGMHFWLLLPLVPLFGLLKVLTSCFAWFLHWKYRMKK